jgi:hypothetical protein
LVRKHETVLRYKKAGMFSGRILCEEDGKGGLKGNEGQGNGRQWEAMDTNSVESIKNHIRSSLRKHQEMSEDR